MGDRVYVTLTVPSEHVNQVREIYKDWCFDEWSQVPTGRFGFDDVKFGELPHLTTLRILGIAYSTYWGKGRDIEGGEQHCRFTADGEIRIKTLNNHDHSISLTILKDLLNHPSSMVSYVKAKLEYTSILPWDNQVEYGRLYQAKRLITGSSK